MKKLYIHGLIYSKINNNFYSNEQTNDFIIKMIKKHFNITVDKIKDSF